MKTILVVEDEPLIRLSLVQTLRRQNYEVTEGRDGRTAIDLIAVKTFAGVICDHRMPGSLTGLDVLLHYHSLHPNKVKVLLTGQADRDAQEKVRDIGGIYLLKPVSVEDVIATLDRLLTTKQTE